MYDAYDASACAAWKEGYRPGRKLPFTSSFTVTVITPNGPWKHKPVRVEYVYAFDPPELRHPGLWATGTRDEPDGTSWRLKCEVTDESGTAHFGRLPYVQCKVMASAYTTTTFPSGDLRMDITLIKLHPDGK